FGLSRESKIIKMLQRATGHRRLNIFIQHYPLFYLYERGVEELLSACSVSVFLTEDVLLTIVALKALLCHFIKTESVDDALNSWVDCPFSEALLASILHTANAILKDVGIVLELEKHEECYSLNPSTETDIPRIIHKINEKLKSFNLKASLQLQKLLDPKNAVYYRLLQNPEGKAAVCYLDTRPWKAIFSEKNLQSTMIKLFTKGIKDNDILVEDIENEELIRQITPVKENDISLPVAVIDTLVDDYFNSPACQLIVSDDIPSDSEIKPDCLYLYKTEKSLEAVMKRDNKLTTVMFSHRSFTTEQYKELMQCFGTSGSTVELHQFTLHTLSRLCFESGKGCYVFAEDPGNIFEFLDDFPTFHVARENKFVQVTKIEKRATQRVDESCLVSSITRHLPLQSVIPETRAPEPVNLLSMPQSLEDLMSGPQRENELTEPKPKRLKLIENVSQPRLKDKKDLSLPEKQVATNTIDFDPRYPIGEGTYNR
ncbi:MAG TPA: hypothetical protein VNX68_15475, partial [Nitrosopumilaceae archaeon]|nr:hypothetical protein [Nitrosopumilaceae archaeon]